jgi:hypothetical protein
MKRFRLPLLLSIPVMLAFVHGSLRAQAMVEGATAAGASAVGSAPARNVGKSINGLTDQLNNVLKGAADTGAASAKQAVRTTTTQGTALPPPKPAAALEDPLKIQAGMTDEEVLRRFGPPNLRITEDTGISSLLYSGKSGRVRVLIQDGKVSSVEKPQS